MAPAGAWQCCLTLVNLQVNSNDPFLLLHPTVSILDNSKKSMILPLPPYCFQTIAIPLIPAPAIHPTTSRKAGTALLCGNGFERGGET
jgi:hypothetical protein